MSMPQIIPSRSGSKEFLELVWDEFFLSKHRGISLEVHFPWMFQVPCPGTFMEIYQSGRLLGGLVLKSHSSSNPLGSLQIGAIGLVCIHPNERGRGLSQILLRETIDHAADRGFAALTLWTGKPNVYEKVGFQLEDSALYGWVTAPCTDFRPAPSFSRLHALPTIGVPPFAQTVEKSCGDACSFTVVRDTIGPIVAEWSGASRPVADLMDQVLPQHWRLNAWEGDGLLDELSAAGFQLQLKPSHLQMWLPLTGSLTSADLARDVRFSVLDRV